MLLNYLPYFMQNIEEIKKIMYISEPEIETINKNIEILLNDLFVLESSQNAVNHYEKMLDIVPKLTDSIEKRKYDILALYNQTLPFTLESLQEKLSSICGEDGYILEMIYDKFILNVKISLKNKELFTTVNNLLELIVPVNLIINSTLDYNVWEDLHKYKWGHISKYKWGHIKDSEEIKNKV
ncbi:putative phage tail protein [uncultured Tyzzerella sp.]|uniref:putative phage tail protein n=1 Tax=uncultured Tyzzerella sp. TaxID=2321398 RepID=UPI002942B493|nr:putative phage tail protein [uncultured Tyzzerella sp.]